MDPKKGLEAALQTKISIFPSWSLVSSTNNCKAVLSDILQGITIASPSWPSHALFISAAVSSQTSAFLLETTTLAP